MSKQYSALDCRRKANQHWEMAGLARQDRDLKDSNRHTELAYLWDTRANQGGYQETPTSDKS